MKISPISLELLDFCGTDLSVVNAARVSFHKESRFVFDTQDLIDSDIKLIKYLAKNGHWTPFAHCFLSFRIKVPMFVAMQLDKHTVGLVTNSVSRRYVDEEPEFWFPKEWRGRSSNAKQGSEGVIDNKQPLMHIPTYTHNSVTRCLECYLDLLIAGVAPEQARMMLPMNTMTERIWSGSLHAFARVYKLRSHPHAQKEIQEVATKLDKLIYPMFPVSWNSLVGVTENA